MAGTGTISSVGTYLEIKDLVLKPYSFGAYLEINDLRVIANSVGVYIEENWDASPIIVSTDGEQSSIFGVIAR